ncbi:MAG: PP2C family protein-serine/threonine phosphatase [Colwellia sp.]
MTYYIESLCHQGNYRKNNEDALSYGMDEASGCFWMLVADGMGGHNAGEVASNMLVSKVEKQWQALHESTSQNMVNFDWSNWIATQLNDANLDILQAATNDEQLKGMGTTGVLMVVCDNTCYIGWVGDTRAYFLHKNTLKQVTTDHTMIQVLLKKGAITALEAKNANTNNLLSQAIGVTQKIDVDTLSFNIEENDVIMLSTDGLHDYLSDEEISQYLSDFSEERAICDDMVERALSQSSKDNLTLGVLKLLA